MSEDPGAVLITGCSSGIGHETAKRLAAKGWTVYATARRPESIADLGRGGLRDARPRRHRRGLDEGGGRRGRGRARRGRSARQQRRLQPVRRARDAADGAAAGPVRDQRLRAGADVPARAAEDARRRPRADRQRQLDGRQAGLPRRRRLPRDQVRGRGALRRAAVRGQGIRDPRLDHRARADHDQLRRDRGGVARPSRRPRARAATTTRTRASTPPSARPRSASTRAR